MSSQPSGGTFPHMIYILSCLFGKKVVLLVPLLLWGPLLRALVAPEAVWPQETAVHLLGLGWPGFALQLLSVECIRISGQTPRDGWLELCRKYVQCILSNN